MARFSLATGLAPSEIRQLTLEELIAFKKAVEERNQ
jgi:hypothetical protein